MNRNTLAAVHALEQIAENLRSSKTTQTEADNIDAAIQRLRDSLGRPDQFHLASEVEAPQHQHQPIVKR